MADADGFYGDGPQIRREQGTQEIHPLAIAVTDRSSMGTGSCAENGIDSVTTPEPYTIHDFIDALLQAFNPNPASWYVAPAQMLRTEGAVGTVPTAFRDPATLPDKLLFPICTESRAHWTLAVFDRTTKDCYVFDPEDSQSATEPTWTTVKLFLEQTGILQGEATKRPDVFPTVRQNDTANNAILVAALALHVMHSAQTDDMSEGILRELLAEYLPTGNRQPGGWWESRLAELTARKASETRGDVGVEGNTKDAEALDAAVKVIQSYARESRVLLEMIESQLQRAEMHRELANLEKWCQEAPRGVDVLLSALISRSREGTTKKLKALPNLSEECSLQLRSFREKCMSFVGGCDRSVMTLEKRRAAVVDLVTAKHRECARRLAACIG